MQAFIRQSTHQTMYLVDEVLVKWCT